MDYLTPIFLAVKRVFTAGPNDCNRWDIVLAKMFPICKKTFRLHCEIFITSCKFLVTLLRFNQLAVLLQKFYWTFWQKRGF